MKKNIKKLIRGTIVIFSFFFTRKMSITISIFFNRLYVFWYSREFKNLGDHVYFEYPLYLKGGKYISIGTNVGIDQRFRLDAIDEFLGDKFTPEIVIGNDVSIQKDCHIGAINKIVIGNNVLLASKVYISDHFHGEITSEALLLPPAKRKLYSKGPVIIEDNVWLGEGVIILPNVTIGKNCIIGANSVITKSIPENCVVAGNPARIIRELV